MGDPQRNFVEPKGSGIRRTVAFAVFWLGYVPALTILPTLRPPEPEMPGVAALAGYDSGVAFLAAASWSLVGVAGLGLAFARGWLVSPLPPKSPTPPTSPTSPTAPAAPPAKSKPSGPPFAVEAGLAVAACIAVYFPPFLARYGPFIEDNYFLSVLARMACGQVPYADFEFLYGPLMIAPLDVWVSLFGLSMKSYYGFIVVLEALLYVGLIAVLRRHLPDWRWRILALALLLPLVLDTLLGPNWSGWRRLLSVYALLILAHRPFDRRAGLAAGALLGVHLAFSHDYGLLGVTSMLLTYGLIFLFAERRAAFVQAVVVAATAVLVWLGLALLTTGSSFPEYLASSAVVVEAVSSGLVGFRFYFTVNSFAGFGLLAAVLMGVASGLPRLSRERLASGDFLLVSMALLAILTLKSGLVRADVYHFDAAMLPLVFAAVISLPTRVFAPEVAGRHTLLVTSAVVAVTCAVGILPTAGYFGGGTLRGARDALSGIGPGGEIRARTFTIEGERTEPWPEFVALAEYLSDESRRDQPVLYFGDIWFLGHRAGTCSLGYHLDDFLYSEARHPVAAALASHPDALVVMPAYAYQRIFEGEGEPPVRAHSTVTTRLASWLATVHYEQGAAERKLKLERWVERVGPILAAGYTREATFGDYVVVGPRGDAAMNARVR